MKSIMHETETISPPTPKPVSAVALSLANIPKELKLLDRWILWKYTWKPKTKKWTKTPHSPSNGHAVDATNHANGTTFEMAVQALRKNKTKFDGLGFLLGAGKAGIDVDDCIDEDGNLDARGQAISSQYAATYAEVSPSGRGFKLIVDIGDDPKLAVIGKNTADMEIYGGKRYFTVTGAILPGHAKAIAPMAEAFAATAAQIGASRPAPEVADMPTGESKQALGIGLAGIRELFDHLPFNWIDNYFDWLKGGMAIHHESGGSKEGLALWDEISSRNPDVDKYQPEACAEKWQTFGKPGREVFTVRTLIQKAQATGWRAPRTIESAVQDFTPFDDPNPIIDEDGVLSEPPTWWARYSMSDLLLTPAPERKWIWKRVLCEGKLMLLAGSGGSSKSYLMLSSVVQYALGNDWGPFELDNSSDRGKVLMLYAEEDKEDIHGRVQNLKHTFMLTDEQARAVGERIAVLPLRGAQVELAKQTGVDHEVVMTKQLDRLEERIKEYGVKLVVLDPLAMFHSLEENNNVVIAALMHGLDALCMRNNCAIVLVHHFGKGGTMTAREVNESNVRGASSLVAHARTVVVMHRLRRDEATQWGVTEDDAARWVMWTVAKTNNGPTGQQFWFEVNPNNGSIHPASTQLEYRNVSSIREAAQAHLNETLDSDISDREFRRAQEAALQANLKTRQTQILLRYAEKNGLPGKKKCLEILRESLPATTGLAASNAHSLIKDTHLVDTDGLMSLAGFDWLEAHAILE